MSTNLDYGMRIVEQTGPISSLCWNGGKWNYQIIRSAMQIIKIESCAKDGLCDYIGCVVREGYDLSESKEAVTWW